MNRKQATIAAASLLGLGLLTWAAWPAAQQVETAPLTQGDFVRELVEDGRTRVRDRYTVAAPLAGQLRRPALQPGDAVATGQTVATIVPAAASLLDPRSQGEQRERVLAMQAGTERARASRDRAQVARQQAQADLERNERLAWQGFIAPTQLETAQRTLEQREQELTMADQDLRTVLHDLQRLRIGLSQPLAASAGEGWRVLAPVSGRVLRLHRDSEGPIAAGAPILDLGDPQQLEIITDLLTEDAAGLPVQAQATLGHWGGQGRLRAVLSRIEPGAFTKVSALGVEEQRVRAVFAWQDTPPPGLGDGYRMEMRIVVQQAPGVPLAPVSAVFPHGQGHAVFAFDNGRARLHEVQVLGRNDQQVWLQTRLPLGTRLLTYPPPGLHDGDRIRAARPETTLRAPGAG